MGRQIDHQEIYWDQSLSIGLWNGGSIPFFFRNPSDKVAIRDTGRT